MKPEIFHSTATFSTDRAHRYSLWRKWGADELGYAMFIGLNPSTADETLDDPTVRRCIRFARDWGYGALCMTNAFAFRATDPRVMKAHPAPIGDENDRYLVELAKHAGVVVAAWGVHGAHWGRQAALVDLIPNLTCLGVTKDGFPKHPLYLKADLKPIPFTQLA